MGDGMRSKLMLATVLSLVCVLAGCSSPGATTSDPASSSESTTTQSPGSEALYQRQSELFATALEVSTWDAAWTASETGAIPTQGSFTARVLGVDRDSKVVTLDRIQLFVGNEMEAARADGAPEPPSGYYVRDLVDERLEIPMAASAVAVLYRIDTNWAEGDVSIETSASLPVFAMDSAGFARLFESDTIAREALGDVGAVITVRDGEIVSLKGNYQP